MMLKIIFKKNHTMKLECIEDIGAFIKDSRVKYGLTQSQVAFVTKVERSLVNRLEKGKVEGINTKTLFKIVKGLNSSLNLTHDQA